MHAARTRKKRPFASTETSSDRLGGQEGDERGPYEKTDATDERREGPACQPFVHSGS